MDADGLAFADDDMLFRTGKAQGASQQHEIDQRTQIFTVGFVAIGRVVELRVTWRDKGANGMGRRCKNTQGWFILHYSHYPVPQGPKQPHDLQRDAPLLPV